MNPDVEIGRHAISIDERRAAFRQNLWKVDSKNPQGQQMEQEAAQELMNVQGHEPLLVAMRGVAPSEGDVAIGESNQPGVRNGDAMSIGAEIRQHMFRSAEGRLGVDDPVVAEQYP